MGFLLVGLVLGFVLGAFTVTIMEGDRQKARDVEFGRIQRQLAYDQYRVYWNEDGSPRSYSHPPAPEKRID